MWFLYMQAAAVTLNAVVGMIPSGHDQKSTEALADDMFSKRKDDDGDHFGLSDLYLIASVIYSLIFIYFSATGR